MTGPARFAALVPVLLAGLASPAQAMEPARMDAFLTVARESGCIVANIDAALAQAGISRDGDGAALVAALVEDDKASQIGDALFVRGDACIEGAGPTVRERFMAAMGQDALCEQPVAGLNDLMARYGLTPADVRLLREELEGNEEAVLSADGRTLRIEDAQCARARELAAETVPHAETAFLAFMASHDCRLGRRDRAAEIARAGLDPVATDIVIEKLVSAGQAIYYGPDESLIVFYEHCK